jgi:hypothetical protein
MNPLKTSHYTNKLSVKTDASSINSEDVTSMRCTLSTNLIEQNYLLDLLQYFGTGQFPLSSALGYLYSTTDLPITPSSMLNTLIELGLLPHYDPIHMLLAIERLSPNAILFLRSLATMQKYYGTPWYVIPLVENKNTLSEDSITQELFEELFNEGFLLPSYSSPGSFLAPFDHNLILDSINLLTPL